MDILTVTNNSKIEDDVNVIRVSGDYRDVLIKVRDMVYIGHELISYPLNASIKMFFSPVKSILISKERGSISEHSIELIENSILKYDFTLGKRKPEYRHKDDYELLDFELYKSSLEEAHRFNFIRKGE
ncbi:GrdX family protein [Lagierella massiliensis]|uniref:GrdX family protein n=1 Tax=Lagierella massiliensis TaxID=1689303 RepID=UPI0006D79A39|nr:GrdX family protein [Lagierella massiliensis]